MWCYKMCSIDSGLWCWDARTQAASDDAPSPRWAWGGLLSFSFEVCGRQGRVTLPCKCLRVVRAPNTCSPSSKCSSLILNVCYTISLPSRAPLSRGKNHQSLLVHRWKTFLMSLDRFHARHLRIFSMKPPHLFLYVLHTFVWLPSILILRAASLFHKIPKPFHRFIPYSNLLRVGNDLSLDNPFHVPF